MIMNSTKRKKRSFFHLNVDNMTTAWKWMSSIIEVFKSFKKTRLNLLRNEKKTYFIRTIKTFMKVYVCAIF